MHQLNVRARLAASAVLLLLPACEQPCPSQPSACSSSASLHFALTDGVPQAYEVRVRLRENGVDEEDRCLLIAPLPSDWPSGSFTASCARNAISLYIRPLADMDCDTDVTPQPGGVRIGGGCETTSRGRELVLTRAGKPETIEIELSSGGVSYNPLSITPQYADFFPDGEHCSARCPVASEQRSFDELTEPAGG